MTPNSVIQQEFEPSGLRRVILARGRGNALEVEGLRELEAAFGPGELAVPTVLCSEGRSFCTGLDLQISADLDESGMRELMEAFHRALRAVFDYSAPVVAAISGHAMAGGALLAFACDQRVMAQGSGRFGVHGVQLGVVYPDVAVEILRHQIGVRAAEQILYEGLLGTDARALERGWVDELVPASDLLATASERAFGLAAGGKAAFALTKKTLRRPSSDALAVIDDARMQLWLDQWFAPQTRKLVAEARLALGNGAGHKPGDHPAHHAG